MCECERKEEEEEALLLSSAAAVFFSSLHRPLKPDVVELLSVSRPLDEGVSLNP